MKIKFMTLNMRDGGLDEDGGSRIELIAAVIKEAKPDFVALQEAHGFEENERQRLLEFSRLIELPYCDLSPGTPREFDNLSNVANFSNVPFVPIEEEEGFKFPGCRISGGALLSVIASPLGELAICNLHLDAYIEQFRLRELNAILHHTLTYENVIIVGDFNSVLVDCGYTHETIEVEYSFAAMRMLQRHYVDVAANLDREAGTTFPTPINTHLAFTQPLRVDYAFVSLSLADHVTDVAVIKTPDSEQASDHYPLVVTFELE